MPGSNPLMPRRLPKDVRRRLEVATATAWEALVSAHTSRALQFIGLFADMLPFDEGVTRYLREMDVPAPMAAAVRNRVLIALEDAERIEADRPSALRLVEPDAATDEEAEGWRRFRPDVVMRGVVQRQRRHEETERWIQLVIARAEEGVMATHIDNAITFAALLEAYLPADESIEAYIDALGLAGGRAQGVLQRTMARLADVHLAPPHPKSEPSGPAADAARPARERGRS